MSEAGRVISRLLVAAVSLSFFSAQPVSAEPVSPPSQAAEEQTIVDGVLLDKRKALCERIKGAARDGIGTAAYMSAFRSLEEMVKSGSAETKVQERIDSINRGLDDQVKRAQILKTQRPAPPVQLSGSSLSGSGDKKDGLGDNKGSSDRLMDKLKERFGDRIPADLDTDALKKRLMQDERAKEILKKLGQ